MFYAVPKVPCLGDSSDKKPRCLSEGGVYLREAFMTAFVVYPKTATIKTATIKTAAINQ